MAFFIPKFYINTNKNDKLQRKQWKSCLYWVQFVDKINIQSVSGWIQRHKPMCKFQTSSFYSNFKRIKNLLFISIKFNKENCKELVDSYVECEYSVILIDLILFKKRAYRHILINSELKVEICFFFLKYFCYLFSKNF